MKLQRRETRKVGDTTYYKWAINPPPDLIDKLGWKPGDELDATVERGRLILTRAKP